MKAVVREYTLFKAANGRQALDTILDQNDLGEPIDVLITDNSMPVMNGRELAMELREREIDGALPKMGIVLVSGDFMDRSRNVAEFARRTYQIFDECLLKPFSFEQLGNILQSFNPISV